VIASDAATSVANIARILGERRIGSVVITRDEKPVGIFTERDFLTKFFSRERNLSVNVGEAC
jgi:CBS domain-containing protein